MSALNSNSVSLLKARYCRRGESPEHLFKRVANVLSMGDSKFEDNVYDAMINGIFLPASPVLRNAGQSKQMLHPCFFLDVTDSISGIMTTLSRAATIFHYGGGVGFNASKLRPKGDKLTMGGTSSGVVSFLGLFDELTEVVKQGGFRRGALMGILDYNHPEIIPFISSKLTGKLTNFNISVLVNDEFMRRATMNDKDTVSMKFKKKSYGTIRANDIFDNIVLSAYLCGDPGLLFYDRINKDNKLYPSELITGTNPCGEVPLPVNTCCNLGSINLTKFVEKDGSFNFDCYAGYVEAGMRALKNINKVAWYPFPKMTERMDELDLCGLGHMGLADALIMMGIYYNSKEALDFLDELKKPYVDITESIGGNSFYKRSQAPTGSLSIIADCSSGIEPVFDTNFSRHLTVGVINEVRDIYKSKYCVTAHDISPVDHLKIQAKVQSFTDAGVSKTINLRHDATLDDIRRIYIRAWKSGVKGITVFRDSSKEGVLQKVKCSDESCHL